MFSRKHTRGGAAICVLLAVVLLTGFAARNSSAQEAVTTEPARHSRAPWETQAREQRIPLWPKVHGTLTIDDQGVGFRADKGHARHWTFAEIHTAFLGPHRLVLETYLNRSLHRPGEQHFKFDFSHTLPPAVAAALAARIARPVQNADPDASAPTIVTIPARHRLLMRGTNGVLRFRKNGIGYVTSAKGDSRSWRWADLQALSEPDPYHLCVFGYRDTYTFDLKAPLSRALFNYATDAIYRASEAGGPR